MKTQKTLRRMDQALLQLQLAREILVSAHHSETFAKAVAETMAEPLDTVLVCMERLMFKK